jgi:superfamily II DNA or RNA helicase
MVQSISKRDYDPEIFKDIGVLICDESHHFGAKHFSKALAKICPKYTIGLSATPNRTDGLMKVVNWYLGDIMYQKKMQTNNQVVVKHFKFFSKSKLFEEKKRYIKGDMKPDCVKMINNLVKLKYRTHHIINIIDTLRKNPDRKILILSGRVEHLTKLKDEVDKLIQEDITNGKILEDECKTYYYIGSTKQKERQEAEKNGDILFATFEMAQEGLDIPNLNAVIFATPKKNVVQSAGRVLRKILQDGDIRPLIIDISDELSIFKSQSKVRERFYKQTHFDQYYCYTCEDLLVSEYAFYNYSGEPKQNVSKDKPNNYEELLDVPPVEIIEEKDEKDIKESEEEPIKQKNKKTKKKTVRDTWLF